MILETLGEYATVEDAAEAMAGNWKRWSCFVWFGADDVPEPHNVMLGYLVNPEYTLRQLTNLEYVRKALANWWGDLTQGAQVGDYGASLWGDRDALNGLALRVYDSQGEITKPFRVLYILAKHLRDSGDGIIDRETFERVQRRELLGYVYRELEHECRKRQHPFSMELAESITDELIAEDHDFDNNDTDRAILEAMGWAEGEDD